MEAGRTRVARARRQRDSLIDLGWGEAAAAWIPLRDFDIEHVLGLRKGRRREDREGDLAKGQELPQAARSTTRSSRKTSPRAAEPGQPVAPPPQAGVRLVRKPYLPRDCRGDQGRLPRARGARSLGIPSSTPRQVVTPAGVPVPPVSGFAQTSSRSRRGTRVRRISARRDPCRVWTSLMPRKASVGSTYHLPTERRRHDRRRDESSRYPERTSFCSATPKTLARRAAVAAPDGFCFGIRKLVSGRRANTELARGLLRPDRAEPRPGSEFYDPYALRHIYATLRIAAHHPTLYIEGSMGRGLSGGCMAV